MAFRGNGSSSIVRTSSTVTATALWTAFFWGYFFEASSTSSFKIPYSFTGPSVAGEWPLVQFAWSHTNAIYQRAWIHHLAGTPSTYIRAKYTTALAPNQWHALLGLYDGSYVRAFYNEVNEASMAGGAQPLLPGTPSFVADYANGSPASHTQVAMRWPTVWSVALGAEERNALMRGVPPWKIRRDAQIVCCPMTGLASAEPDWSPNRRAMTLTAGTLYTDPPVEPLWLPGSMLVTAAGVDEEPAPAALSLAGPDAGLVKSAASAPAALSLAGPDAGLVKSAASAPAALSLAGPDAGLVKSAASAPLAVHAVAPAVTAAKWVAVAPVGLLASAPATGLPATAEPDPILIHCALPDVAVYKTVAVGPVALEILPYRPRQRKSARPGPGALALSPAAVGTPAGPPGPVQCVTGDLGAAAATGMLGGGAVVGGLGPDAAGGDLEGCG